MYYLCLNSCVPSFPICITDTSLLAAWGSTDTPARAHATAAKGRFLPSCPAQSAETWGRLASRLGVRRLATASRVPPPPTRRWPAPPADVAWGLPSSVEVILDKEHTNATPPSPPSLRVPHDC